LKTGFSSMMGLPSLSVTQPGRSGEPTRMASRILLPAMADVAASNSSGASRRAGAAIAMGFVPSSGLAAKVGTTLSPAPVKHTPTMSSRAACSA
jgi:hypothetical protein